MVHHGGGSLKKKRKTASFSPCFTGILNITNLMFEGY